MFGKEKTTKVRKHWIAFVSQVVSVVSSPELNIPLDIPVLLLSHGFHMLKVHISTYRNYVQRIRFIQEKIDAFLAHIKTTVKP